MIRPAASMPSRRKVPMEPHESTYRHGSHSEGNLCRRGHRSRAPWERVDCFTTPHGFVALLAESENSFDQR